MKPNAGFLLIVVAAVAGLGGVLFGYNTAVISGALLFVKRDFDLTLFDQSLLVSMVLIGAILGAMFGGSLADYLGRRKAIIVTSLLFIAGGLVLSIATSMWVLLVGRFISGLGVGASSLAVPLYLAELSPPSKRGALVTVNQLGITLGILGAYIINYLFSGTQDWRMMFGLSAFPAAAQFIGMFFLPESPNWLFLHEKKEKARAVLEKYRRGEDHDAILWNMGERAGEERGSAKEVFSKKFLPALITGVGLSILQQITGINVVIYYAPTILEKAGITSAEAAILATVGIGCINVLVTVVSLWLLDKVGRRILLLIGVVGMSASLLVLSLFFFLDLSQFDFIAVLSLMCYVSFFAVGLGPVTWLIIAEIYPLKIRGRAMSIAMFSNWFFNFVISITFLSILKWLGSGGAFLMYACICLFALYFVFRRVPETKGKSLEEIELFWRKKGNEYQ